MSYWNPADKRYRKLHCDRNVHRVRRRAESRTAIRIRNRDFSSRATTLSGAARREVPLYCAAYGNGLFHRARVWVRAISMNGREGETERRGEQSGKIFRAQPVTQKIALSVKGDKVECAINGTVVASYRDKGLHFRGCSREAYCATGNGVYRIAVCPQYRGRGYRSRAVLKTQLYPQAETPVST